jgi:hypothetical protein
MENAVNFTPFTQNTGQVTAGSHNPKETNLDVRSRDNFRSYKEFILQLMIVRFEVITAADMKMSVFWIAVPCSLIQIYRHFKGACYLLHHQTTRLHVATFQKAAIS